LPERVERETELLEDRDRRAFGLLEQRAQQMRGLDTAVTTLAREGLRLGEGFLALDRQLVGLHDGER
jgi:hypothetical protein